MRTRLALLSVLALTACSSGGGTAKSLTTSPSPSEAAPALTRASAAAVPGSSAAPQVLRPTSSGSAVAAPAPLKPLTTTAPGTPAASKATAVGTYTYDASGTVTLGNPGTPQDASGNQTLTVEPIRGGVQRSTLHSDSTGDTVQDVLVRDTGTFAGSITLTSSAFTKQFRPTPAVLLVPDPATPGYAWSWSGTSTDGKTTISASNRISRTETVVVGGVKVPCAVVSTHLVLSGDVDYTADLSTWWAPTYRLPVKTHSVGKGSYNGFPFSTDITATMRSVKPS